MWTCHLGTGDGAHTQVECVPQRAEEGFSLWVLYLVASKLIFAVHFEEPNLSVLFCCLSVLLFYRVFRS